MRRRWVLAGLAVALVSLSCIGGFLLRSCPAIGTCIVTSVHPRRVLWAMEVMVTGGSALTALAWAARLLWLLVQAARGTARLQAVACPPALADATRRTGVGEVVCIAASGVHAFCTGFVRPRIYLTEGVVTDLRPDELDAVLVHEAEHRRRRDPVRRALRRALADVLFFLPIFAWWWERIAEREELAADRAALRATAPRSLAGALVVMGSAAGPRPTVAAFDGAAEARVAQLLGEQPPRRGLPRDVWLPTLVGLGALLSIASCAIPAVIGHGG